MNFLIFPHSSLDLCLGTYSHDARHAYRQRVITSRLLCKIRQAKLLRKNGPWITCHRSQCMGEDCSVSCRNQSNDKLCNLCFCISRSALSSKGVWLLSLPLPQCISLAKTLKNKLSLLVKLKYWNKYPNRTQNSTISLEHQSNSGACHYYWKQNSNLCSLLGLR
jgi:hypothetical protein